MAVAVATVREAVVKARVLQEEPRNDTLRGFGLNVWRLILG